MNQEHKDLLIAAAKAAGIDIFWHDEISKCIRNESLIEWNPITNLSDRYDLARKCGLTVEFSYGLVWAILKFPKHAKSFAFTSNDDESEALAILRAAVASKGE